MENNKGNKKDINKPEETENVKSNDDNYGSLIQSKDNLCTSKPENASKAFENILYQVGDYGYYQWKLTFITGFCGLFTACHNMGAVLLAATPDHWCDIPYFREKNLRLDKSTLNITVPWILGKKGYLEPSKCTYYDYDYSSILTQDYMPVNISSVDLSTIINLSPTNVKSCDSWIYDDEIFKSTVVTEWNLVCDDRWMMSSTQATYMMGILTGAVLFSAISDKMGRRVSTLICCVLFFVASVSAAFTKSFVLFLVLRFIVAGSGQGMFLVNFILLMETVSLKGRNVMGNLFHIFFTFGFALLALDGYLVRDWRHLQLIISVPTVLLLGYYWLLPESPRWLLMHGKEEEGLKILKSIAEANRKTFPPDEELKPLLDVIAEERKHQENPTVIEKIKSFLNSLATLVRTPNMRRRNLIVFYAWFVTSMIYYGLSFSGSNLSASLYLTVTVAALIEIPALIIVILLLFKFGRRTVSSLCFIIGGAACISIIFVPTDMVSWNLTLAMLGKSCLSGSFLVVFMLSAEMVPTHVRNISIGMASMCARIGSGITPFIVDLLGDVYYAIPSTIFGILSLLAGLLSLLLPETGNKRLPESIEEIEAMPR